MQGVEYWIAPVRGEAPLGLQKITMKGEFTIYFPSLYNGYIYNIIAIVIISIYIHVYLINTSL